MSLDDATPAEDVDLSDLATVILNVETRDGRQLSMVWAAEADRLSLEGPHHDDADAGLESWTFTLTRLIESSHDDA